MLDVPPVEQVRSLEDLLALLPSPVDGQRFLLGVAGSPGAGKSTVAQALARAAGATYLPMDGYHLADVELARLHLLDRKGHPDTFDPYGFAQLLGRLRQRPDHVVYAPAFDRALEQPLAGAVPIAPSADLVITEGNYLLLDQPAWRQVRHQLDEVWFVDVEDNLRRSRLLERHIRFGKSQSQAHDWIRDVDEPNAERIQASRSRADRIIDLSSWHADSTILT
jgi:pantothenate kinase